MRASMGSAVPKCRTHEAKTSQHIAHNAERRKEDPRPQIISLPETILVKTFT